MGNVNQETENPFAILLLRGGGFCERGSGVVRRTSFLTGVVLAVVLGLMFALSTPAFAMGGGGGGGAASPPKVTKVGPVVDYKGETVNNHEERSSELHDSSGSPAETKSGNDMLGDGVAGVGNPATEPEEETPEVSELTVREPEEKSLSIKEPVNKPDTNHGGETAKTKNSIAKATVGTVSFGRSSSVLAEGVRVVPSLRVRLDKIFSHPIKVFLNGSGTGTIGEDIEMPGSVTFEPGEKVKFLRLMAIDDVLVEDTETITISISGNFPEGLSFGEYPTHSITIHDNDGKPVIGGIEIEKEGEISITNDEKEYVGRVRLRNFGDGGISFENRGVVDGPMSVSQRGDGGVWIENHGVVDSVIWVWPGYPAGKGARKIVNRGTIAGNMRVRHRGRSEISIENYGYVGDYIDAKQLGISSGSSDISIENHGTVDNYGYGRGHIRAVHYGNGNISITNTHQGFVKSDIIASQGNGSGNISIENHGTVGNNARFWDGRYRDDEGYIRYGNAGYVNEGHMRVWKAGEGDVSIENHGTVYEFVLVERRGGEGDVSIENHGTVYEFVGVGREVGEGDVSIENHGTVGDFISVRHSGEGGISIENHGAVARGVNARHYGDNGVVRFDGNVMGAVETHSPPDRTTYVEKLLFEGGIKSNFLEGKSIHLGDVVFRGSWNDELEAVGGYEASDETRLKFYVFDGGGPSGIDSGEWDRDLLKITGNVTGRSLVSLIMPDALPSSFTTDSGPLIEVDGEAQADNFVGEETVGAFRYVLEHEFEDLHRWRFVNRGPSDVAVKTSQIPYEIAENIETPPTANPDKQTKKLGLWGEQQGSHTAMGLDALATRWMGGDMTVGTSMAQNFSTSNNISVESQITALAASWERRGFYVGGQTRYASFTSDASTNRLSVVQDNEGTGVNASVDLGYFFALSFGGMDFEVAPQAQLVWSRVNFDDFVGPHGEKISLEDGDRVIGRLGLSWDGKWQGVGGFGRIYGGMNLRGDLDGETSVNVSGVSITNEQKGLSIDGRLGVSYEWNEGYAVHGEALALRRDDDEEVRANLGLHIDF